MALRIFNVKMTPEGVEKTIKDLQKYKKSLDDKLKDFVTALGMVGIDTINAKVAEIDPSELHSEGLTTSRGNIEETPLGIKMYIQLHGKDVLFVEFSAGITYGSNNYPISEWNIYGMGTYPSEKENWKNPDGWYYRDENEQLKHTYGFRAYMPMYYATESMAMMVWLTAMKTLGV